MLILYRVEGLTAGDIWETIRVCRLPYRKTETFKMERYGLLKLKKRRVITNCVIHNKSEADAAAWKDALKHFNRNMDGYKKLRITATKKIDGVLSTEVVKPIGAHHAQQGLEV